MSEEDAYPMTANHLIGLQNYRKNNPRPGHNYCQELQALMAQYVDRYPPRDRAKVLETCPLALPAGALEPRSLLAQGLPAPDLHQDPDRADPDRGLRGLRRLLR
jgi:hypothetical protein